jgi:hypothetical protein
LNAVRRKRTKASPVIRSRVCISVRAVQFCSNVVSHERFLCGSMSRLPWGIGKTPLFQRPPGNVRGKGAGTNDRHVSIRCGRVLFRRLRACMAKPEQGLFYRSMSATRRSSILK